MRLVTVFRVGAAKHGRWIAMEMKIALITPFSPNYNPPLRTVCVFAVYFPFRSSSMRRRAPSSFTDRIKRRSSDSVKRNRRRRWKRRITRKVALISLALEARAFESFFRLEIEHPSRHRYGVSALSCAAKLAFQPSFGLPGWELRWLKRNSRVNREIKS